MKKKAKKTATKKKTRKKGQKDQLKADLASIAQILSVVALEIDSDHDHAAETVEGWRKRLDEIHARWQAEG